MLTSETIGKKFGTLTVYDVLPEFDSYLADVEQNLEMDEESWKAYQADPYPVAVDVLSDFGEFARDVPRELASHVIETVAERWAHPRG